MRPRGAAGCMWRSDTRRTISHGAGPLQHLEQNCSNTVSRVHLHLAGHEHWSQEASGPGRLPAARSLPRPGGGQTCALTRWRCGRRWSWLLLGLLFLQGELCLRWAVSEPLGGRQPGVSAGNRVWIISATTLGAGPCSPLRGGAGGEWAGELQAVRESKQGCQQPPTPEAGVRVHVRLRVLAC